MPETPKDSTHIVYYDEIRFSKKGCKDLKLDNLGYSCDKLESLEISKIDTIDNPREELEHIIVVKNKTDKNVLIKVRGFDKELLVEEAMKKCTDKHKEGCYVHYSSTVRYGQ